MLVLTRKLGEEILIGEDVRVRVLSVRGNRVRLGLVAPPHIAIRREELLRLEPSALLASSIGLRSPATPVAPKMLPCC